MHDDRGKPAKTEITLSNSAMMPILVRLRTASGSEYLVKRHSDDSWWCSARNVPNASSTPLDGTGWWRIARPFPWPPIIGCYVVLMALPEFLHNEPRRMPGGGKWTSPVIEMLWIEPSDAHPPSAPYVP